MTYLFENLSDKQALDKCTKFLDENMPGLWVLLVQLSDGECLSCGSKSLTRNQIEATIKNFAKQKEI